jgi:hypothetical protein
MRRLIAVLLLVLLAGCANNNRIENASDIHVRFSGPALGLDLLF